MFFNTVMIIIYLCLLLQARAEEIAAVIDQKNEHSKKLLKKIDQFKNEKRDLQEKIDELAQDLKVSVRSNFLPCSCN